MLILFYSQTYLHLAVFIWRGKRTHSWSISTKALPEWYKHLIFNPWNVCKYLEFTIEVALILFYSLTYLCLGIPEIDFGRSGVVNRLVCAVSVPRHFLNDTNILYNPCNVCKHLEVTIEVALILFYSLTYLRLGVSKLDFVRSGVVKDLVYGVWVPRHFLNDTNILHTTHVTYANTWKSQLNWRSFYFTA